MTEGFAPMPPGQLYDPRPSADGGPAFPRYGNDKRTFASSLCQDGMSLRDYFAGQALAGLCAAEQPIEIVGVGRVPVSEAAYWFADAMLRQRDKGKP